jgi:hypothetical protein
LIRKFLQKSLTFGAGLPRHKTLSTNTAPVAFSVAALGQALQAALPEVVCAKTAGDVRCDLAILNDAEPIFRMEAIMGHLLFTCDFERWLRFYECIGVIKRKLGNSVYGGLVLAGDRATRCKSTWCDSDLSVNRENTRRSPAGCGLSLRATAHRSSDGQ